MMLRLLIILCVALSTVWADDQRLLQAGDVLFVSFAGEEAFNREFAIDIDGKIDLPELGLFSIAGQPLTQAEENLRQLLALLYLNASQRN